jgi:hypothetical protein
MTVEPTPPRQPQVYLTGNHVVPDVGLGNTVVEPPGSAVVAPTTAVDKGTQTRPLYKVRKWTADVNTQTDQSVFPFVG